MTLERSRGHRPRSSTGWTRWGIIGIVGLLLGALWVGPPPPPRVGGSPATFLLAAATGSANPCGIPNGNTHFHDLVVQSANASSLFGQGPRFFATLPGLTVGTSYFWWFGDGSFALTHSAEEHHIFGTPGWYSVCATATDLLGRVHDSRSHLLLFHVLPSGSGDPGGQGARLDGSITGNTTSGSFATPFVAPGGWVSVRVTALLPPTSSRVQLTVPFFSVSKYAGSAAALGHVTLAPNGTSSARLTFASTAPAGLYDLNYSLATRATVGVGWVRTWSNFTFTILVGSGIGGPPPGHADSSHHGTLDVVEFAPHGATSFDPAIDYESAGAEAMANVYQTLITANGSAVGRGPASFVPDLATCVPGGPRCLALYHSTLTHGDNLTFVLNNRSMFYDPSTGASWGVWPTDVMFSLLRTMALTNSPCWGCNGGWMVSEGLLPAGSYAWDSAIHLPVNNTPRSMFGAITINSSSYCPRAALQPGQRGCVTLDFSHRALVPGFRNALEVLASPIGASVVSCGWFSARAQGLGIPYWTLGNVSGAGDQPCPTPGTGGYGVNISSVPATGFDNWELNGSLYPYQGHPLQSMVGSGPYYLAHVTWGFGYELRTNPGWSAVPTCTTPGCLPPAGTFIPHVNVTWAASGGAVQSAVLDGRADLATFPSNSTSLLVSDVGAGVVGLAELPSFTTFFDPLNLWSNATLAAQIAGQNMTAPSTLLDDLNLRQFLVHAFPYDSATTYAYSSSGLATRWENGGAIPDLLGPSTPGGIGWPSGNPDPNASHVGGAGWWWNQTAHDAMVGPVCTPLTPCTFLLAYPTNSSTTLQADRMWAASVATLSNRSILPQIRNESVNRLVSDTLYAGPGGLGPSVTTGLSWTLDYADPSDAVDPFYLPDSSYTASNSVAERLNLFNATNCSTSLSNWSASTSPIPDGCQGAAYDAMIGGIHQADASVPGPQRAVLYQEVETVANDLALYLYAGQKVALWAVAPWISPTTLDPSPLTGIAHGTEFSEIRYYSGGSSLLGVRGPFLWPTPALRNQSLNLTAFATGGTGGYDYTWNGLPSGCAALPAATLICIPNASGWFNVTVTVRDATGGSVTSNPYALFVADTGRRARLPRRNDAGPVAGSAQ